MCTPFPPGSHQFGADLEGADPAGIRVVVVTPQVPRWPPTVSKFPRSKMLRAQAEGNQQSTGIERMGKHEENELPIRAEVTRVNHNHLSTRVRVDPRGESLSH
jgi:hypothetical protein